MRHTQKRGTIVSPVPITLRIVSPNLPGLSMVDMPGLTKVPIDGQPKSIVTELENMARDYVKHENVIILAVTPANADLATSDALRLAREVDPTGERTIGAAGCCGGVGVVEQWAVGGAVVRLHLLLRPQPGQLPAACTPASNHAGCLQPACPPFFLALPPFLSTPVPLSGVLTKIDIMDPGTNCRDVLEGASYKLRNGWIGVVNRGQADINSKASGGGGGGQRAVLRKAGSLPPAAQHMCRSGSRGSRTVMFLLLPSPACPHQPYPPTHPPTHPPRPPTHTPPLRAACRCRWTARGGGSCSSSTAAPTMWA